MSDTDFSEITPCGGCCVECGYKENGKCAGCIASDGKCIHMWRESDGICRVYKCCSEHNASVCFLCPDFPCEWLAKWFDGWNKDGIKELKRLSDEYREKKHD